MIIVVVVMVSDPCVPQIHRYPALAGPMGIMSTIVSTRNKTKFARFKKAHISRLVSHSHRSDIYLATIIRTHICLYDRPFPST